MAVSLAGTGAAPGGVSGLSRFRRGGDFGTGLYDYGNPRRGVAVGGPAAVGLGAIVSGLGVGLRDDAFAKPADIGSGGSFPGLSGRG